jgi:hypothetical protein
VSAAGRLSPLASRRLWSLWDMLTFYAPAFLELAKEIGRIGGAIPKDGRDTVIKDPIKNSNISIMQSHRRSFDKLGLSMCRMQAGRIIDELHKDMKAGDFADMCRELYNRLVDECGQFHFISLSPEECRLYTPASPLFGTNVEDKLPSVAEDISEAGKCLGLLRPTAAVFHLMRVMEVGVQKFGDKLGVTLPDEKIWQIILDQVNSEIKKLGKDQPAKKYASVSAHLYNVKLAWRNEAMHPKATYTPEEAEGIFVAVRNFMTDLVGVL